MRVLVACERSGNTRAAFRRLGHDAWSCDLEPAEDGSPYHIQGDAIAAAYGHPWDLMISHSECRYVANSGAKHLYIGMKKENGPDPDRWAMLGAAAQFALTLWRAPIPRKAFEWPIIVGHVNRLFPGFPHVTQIIQPWMFGDFETKATTLRLNGLLPLRPLYSTWQECRDALGFPIDAKPEQRVFLMAPSNTRSIDRARTLPGISNAFAGQWGALSERIAA